MLRWEWRPGSTLYAVWRQHRSGRGDVGDRVGFGDVLSWLGERGDNVFAVKASVFVPVKHLR